MIADQVRGFNISGVQFQSGPLGVREVSVHYRHMKDSVQIEVVAGPPAKLTIPGWDVTRVTYHLIYIDHFLI